MDLPKSFKDFITALDAAEERFLAASNLSDTKEAFEEKTQAQEVIPTRRAGLRGDGEVCYSSTSYGPCPSCSKSSAIVKP